MEEKELPELNDRVLLRIHRKYSKDEMFASVIQELKRVKFLLGEKISEVDELNSLNNSLTHQVNQKNKYKLTVEDMKEERFTLMNKQLSKQGEANARLRKDILFWQTKYLNLYNSQKK